MKSSDVRQMKSLALAYIGDAIYEVFVREMLLERGTIKPNQLHQEAIRYVSGKSQAKVILHWLDKDCFLTKEEQQVAIRGRNAKSGSIPKNISVQTYRYSTAFEALIGYHYLVKNEDRLQALMVNAIQFLEEGGQKHGG